MDWMDEANAYRDLIMTNIEYDILCERHGEERIQVEQAAKDMERKPREQVLGVEL